MSKGDNGKFAYDGAYAGVAQLVEQRICNACAEGSSPSSGFGGSVGPRCDSVGVMTLVRRLARRGRESLRARVQRVRGLLWAAGQATVAAGVAWELARLWLPAPRPVFAPIAAFVALGITVGRRGRQAVEIVLGVAVGIAIADLVARGTGVGALQIVLVAGLAMIAAALVSDAPGLILQAGISGILVVTVERATSGASLERFLEALVGGGVAVVVSLLLFPLDPVATVRRAVAAFVEEVAAVLEEAGAAAAAQDPARARRARDRARDLDRARRRLQEAVYLAREAVRVSPRRAHRRGAVRRYRAGVPDLELAAANVTALVLGANRLARTDEPTAPELAVVFAELAGAIRALGRRIVDPELEHGETRRLALSAASRTATLRTDGAGLSLSALVAYVRSTAVDVLRATGMRLADAQAAVRAASGITESLGPVERPA